VLPESRVRQRRAWTPLWAPQPDLSSPRIVEGERAARHRRDLNEPGATTFNARTVGPRCRTRAPRPRPTRSRSSTLVRRRRSTSSSPGTSSPSG